VNDGTSSLDIRDLARQHAAQCLHYAAARRQAAEQAQAPRTRPKKVRPHTNRERKLVRTLTPRILDYLAANGPATAADIGLALGIAKQALRDRCIDLKADGRLVLAAAGRGNLPAVYAVADGKS
jgi:hypothetical protein